MNQTVAARAGTRAAGRLPVAADAAPRDEVSRKALAIVALTTMAMLAPAAAGAETIEQAVARALVANPRVLAARTLAVSTRFEVTAADSARNTRYGVIAQPAYGYIRGEGSDGTGDFGFQAVKPIWDGDRVDNDVARQTALLASANRRVDLARADVALRVADAYVEVVKQGRLAALARDHVGVIDGLRRRVEEIVRLDRGRAYDLLQTQSRLNQARLALATREGARDEAFAALVQEVGAPLSGVSPPTDPAVRAATLEAVLATLDDHPATLAARAEVEAARSAARIAAAWQKPVVSVRGAVNSPEVTAGDKRWLGGYQVGLVTDWSPFDGGLGEARAQAAQAQIRAAEENVAAVRRDLGTELTRHWSQLQSRLTRAGSLTALVAGTDRVRAAYWEQFQIGRRSMVDLLNAENETFQARVSAETELSELLQVKYRLLGTQAVLAEFLGIEPIAPVPPPEVDGRRNDAPPPPASMHPVGRTMGGAAGIGSGGTEAAGIETGGISATRDARGVGGAGATRALPPAAVMPPPTHAR